MVSGLEVLETAIKSPITTQDIKCASLPVSSQGAPQTAPKGLVPKKLLTK